MNYVYVSNPCGNYDGLTFDRERCSGARIKNVLCRVTDKACCLTIDQLVVHYIHYNFHYVWIQKLTLQHCNQ